MMLHRHFEEDKAAAEMTTSEDLGGKAKETDEFVSEVFPPDPEQPKKTTRRRKSE